MKRPQLSQLQSQFIPISGSMDLTTPPIAKANSEAIMALNVQPNYNGGFSRIEGYECLDGITQPSLMIHCSFTLNRKLGQSAVGKSFILNDRTCYILAVDENRLTVATLGQLEAKIGSSLTINKQTYQTPSARVYGAKSCILLYHFLAFLDTIKSPWNIV